MNEQATAEQTLGNALSDDDLSLVVGGNGDPDDPDPRSSVSK